MSPQQTVELTTSGLSATVDSHGAQLVSLKTAGGQELIWQGDPAYWTDHAPILFPLISQMPDGHIHHGGQAYPMPPHGFAHSMDFIVATSTDSSCVLELHDDEATRAQYPFAFTLRIGFDLSDEALLVTASVENPNDEPMPVDFGFHPGFNWPLTPGREKDEYVVVFEKNEPHAIRRGAGDPVLLYSEGRPTPVQENILHPRDELFEELAIVFDRLNSRAVAYGAPGGPGLRIDFPDSPHLGIWTKPGAPYLCIEPWQGYPSEIGFEGPLVEKPGIVLIEPGNAHRWRLGITLQPDGGLHHTT